MINDQYDNEAQCGTCSQLISLIKLLALVLVLTTVPHEDMR